MKQNWLRQTAAPAAVALSTILALTACGAANESSASTGQDDGSSAAGLSGTLEGAGASSQQAAMQAWAAGFQAKNPEVTVNYDPAGSGAGREQFLAGAVPFAGSDAYLDDDELEAATERCVTGEVIELPVYVSPIAVIYNLDGVDDLQLSPQTLGAIFNGTITQWNDKAIAADNPGVDLPDERITAVHRSDESGTTENFTDYLSAAGKKSWPHGTVETWPIKNGEGAQGTSGVVSAVTNGSGTIGYADASQAGDLGVASIKVGDQYVPYSPEAAAAVVDASPHVAGRGDTDMALELQRDTTAEGVYPIVLVSYHLACTGYETAAEADLVKSFLSYVVSDEGQQTAAEHAGSAPLSADVAQQAGEIIDQISVQG